MLEEGQMCEGEEGGRERSQRVGWDVGGDQTSSVVLVLHRLVRHLSSELYKRNGFQAKVVVSLAQGVVGTQTKPKGGGEGRRPEKAGFKGTHHLLPVRIIFVLVQILPKGDEVTEVSDSALTEGAGEEEE